MIRRYERKSRNSSARSAGYLVLGIGMLGYALPKLPAISFSAAGMFSLAWLLFALLVIGAHLYELIGVGREARQTVQAREPQQAEPHRRKVLMRDK
jgi:hypothetical protein